MNDPYRDLDGHDAYRLLGVPEDATAEDIPHAFRRQLRLWHPDTGNGTAARTRQLTCAREILLNDRPAYDRHRAALRGDGPPRPSTFQSHPTPPRPKPSPSQKTPPPERNPGSDVTVERLLILLGGLALLALLVTNVPEMVRAEMRSRALNALTELPAEFDGEWRGSLVVPGTTTPVQRPTSTVVLSLTKGRIVGMFSYPGSLCQGFVSVRGRDQGGAYFVRSTEDCQSATIRLVREGDGLRADFSETDRSDPYATARLTRQ